MRLLREIGAVLGEYFRGQLRIALILFLLYAIAFALLRVPLWLLFAFFCGLSHLVPTFGPLAAVLLTAGVTLAVRGWEYAIGAVLAFAVIQGLEGFYLTPRILGKRLHLPPLTVFLGMLIAGSLFGIIGLLIAVPVMAITALVWRRMQPRTVPPSPPPGE